MKTCDICGREGTATFNTMVGGRLVEFHLCDRCVDSARKNRLEPIDIVNLYVATKGKFCPMCGTTSEDFASNFMFGCPDCYKNMRVLAMSAVEKVQDGTLHKGKTPRA